jgi:hypothetical protein
MATAIKEAVPDKFKMGKAGAHEDWWLFSRGGALEGRVSCLTAKPRL